MVNWQLKSMFKAVGSPGAGPNHLFQLSVLSNEEDIGYCRLVVINAAR